MTDKERILGLEFELKNLQRNYEVMQLENRRLKDCNQKMRTTILNCTDDLKDWVYELDSAAKPPV